MIKNFRGLSVFCFSVLVAAIAQAASPFPEPSLAGPRLGLSSTSEPQEGFSQEQDPLPDSDPNLETNTNPTAPNSEPASEPADDPRELLVVKLRDEYWETKDKKGAKRKAEPALFDAHGQMTRQWVAKLSEEDFGVLSVDDPTVEPSKRVKELLRDYNKKSQEVATRLTLARRLAKKIMLAHWQSLAQTGVQPDNVPEYARDYKQAVESWFLSRSIEDLKIFEKTRPSTSERERGDKITAELVKKIEEVKQKYEGNLR